MLTGASGATGSSAGASTGSGSSGQGSAPATAAAATPLWFATSILSAMGWPQTQSNINAMVAWEEQEGGNWNNPDSYNPLNTTMDASGAVSTNSQGVKKYTSWGQGIQATVATLKLPAYAGIRQSFESGNASQTLPAALTASPWGTNGAGVASILGSQSYLSYETQTGGSGTGSTAAASGSSSSSDPNGCAINGIGFCILTNGQVAKIQGGLLMAGGALVVLIGFGLIVVATLTETKAGKTAQRAFGAAGLGQVVGAAQAPARVVQGRRQATSRRRASEARQAASEAESTRRQEHRAALDRARLRKARAQARVTESRARDAGDRETYQSAARSYREKLSRERAEARRPAQYPATEAIRTRQKLRRARMEQPDKFKAVFGG